MGLFGKACCCFGVEVELGFGGAAYSYLDGKLYWRFGREAC